MEPFSVQMSKTQKCLAHLGDWVSPDPRLLRLRPPRRPLSSPSCPEFVAPWFPPHSVHASRGGRRGWCGVLGGSPPSALTRAVLILPAVVSGPNPSSVLPSQPVPSIPLPPARPVSPHHDFRGGSPSWHLSSDFMTATVKARQGVEPFSPLKPLLVPGVKRTQKRFLASCFSCRNEPF